MPIEEAEKIAQARLLGRFCYPTLLYHHRYLIKTSDKREKKIMICMSNQKADSNRREERLMTHLERPLQN